MSTITLPYNYVPRYYQLPKWEKMDNGCKRVFKKWCRRAGKDVDDWNYMIKEAFRKVGNYYYIFPEYSQAKRAIWEGKTKAGVRYLDYIPQEWIKSMNSNELKIELHNGSIIRLAGTDDVDKLRGSGPRGVVISEFAFHKNGLTILYEIIFPMLDENNGWIILNSTPNGKNYMYDFENSIAGDKAWYISEIQCLWPDLPNYYPVISTSEIDQLYADGQLTKAQYMQMATQQTSEAIDEKRRAGMDEEKIEQEYGVSYVAGQKGAYYSDCIIKARQEGRIGKFLHQDHKWVDTFWDIGLSDDTAVWFRQIDGNKLIWIDYFEANNKDTAFYIQMLVEKGYRYRTHYLPHDGSSRVWQTNMSNKELFRRLCQEARIGSDVYVAQKPNNKQLPITLTRERFSRYCFDEENCADGIRKLSMYHRQYDKRAQAYRDYPAHDWTCHAADAIAIEGMTASINESFNTTSSSIKIITDFDPIDYGSHDNE